MRKLGHLGQVESPALLAKDTPHGNASKQHIGADIDDLRMKQTDDSDNSHISAKQKHDPAISSEAPTLLQSTIHYPGLLTNMTPSASSTAFMFFCASHMYIISGIPGMRHSTARIEGRSFPLVVARMAVGQGLRTGVEDGADSGLGGASHEL